MSARALASSISEPAAADEAAQARVMSAASAASRRISAALDASCTALMSNACAAATSGGGAIADASFMIAATLFCTQVSVAGDDPESALMFSSAGRNNANVSMGAVIATR